MKMHFLVCYLMVILWVCYGYPMVLTANYIQYLIVFHEFVTSFQANNLPKNTHLLAYMQKLL